MLRRFGSSILRIVLAHVLCFAGVAGAWADSATSAQRPNIVVILADDLGYADISAYQPGRIPTPNIDRLGADGVRFTSGYVAAPVCGPSRAALMTGRYPQRFGFEFNNGPPRRDIRDNIGLDPNERTLADHLRAAGYRTGLVGKWHLGANDAYYPTNRGFDEFYGILPGATSYIDPATPGVRSIALHDAAVPQSGRRVPETQVLRGPNREVVDNENRYLTEEFAAEAEAFVARNAKQPFFLYLAFNAPHSPLQVTQKYYDRFPHIDNEAARIYAGMVSALDDAVGRVLGALEAHGVAHNTLVIFTSDNGCAAYQPGVCSCTPMRGGKLTHFEGGVRVPFLMRWPARVAGGQVFDSSVSTLDVLPTALAAAGATARATSGATAGATAGPERPLDGRDLLAQVASGGDPERALFWWRAPMRSVRAGNWKLWESERGDVGYLFDLGSDPSEARNLFGERPDKVNELRARMLEWHAPMRAPAWPSRPPTRFEACGATVEVPI